MSSAGEEEGLTNTPRKGNVGGSSIVKVICAFVASGVGGPFFGIWPVLQPKFEEIGFFRYACDGTSPMNATMNTSSQVNTTLVGECVAQDELTSSVPAICVTLNIVFMYVIGSLFDVLGPRISTAGGCLCTAVSLVMLAVGSMFPDSLSWLLFVGFFMNISGGSLCSLAVLGFLWKYPTRQTVLTSLSTCSIFFVATGITYLFVSVFPLVTALFLLAAAAAVGVLVLLWAVPSQTEFSEDAEAVLGVGAPIPDCTIYTILCRPLSLTCKIMRLRCLENAAYLTFTALAFGALTYYSSIMMPYFTALLDSQSAGVEVAAMNAVAVITFGAFSPVLGIIGDAAGTATVVAILAALMCLIPAMVWIPNISFSLVTNCIVSVYGIAIVTLYMKWAALYAEPENFGSFMGGLQSYGGLGSLTIVTLAGTWQSANTDVLKSIQVPLMFFLIVACVAAVFLCVLLCVRGVPKEPPKLEGYGESSEYTEDEEEDEDEAELADVTTRGITKQRDLSNHPDLV